MYNDRKKLSKHIIRTLIIVFFVFFKTDIANADNCSTAKIKELKKEAAKIEFVYNLVDEYNPYNEYKYTMNFINFNEKFYIIDSNDREFYYSKSYTNDSTFGNYSPGSRVTFKIYGAYGTTCQDKLIRTAKIALPHYNPYSRYEECKGIEEFKLCKRNYSGKIESEKWFLEKVKEYKESKNKETQDHEEEKNFFQKIMEFFVENPIIIFGVIFVAIIAIALFIIRYLKNRKNIKIDLNIKDLEE